MTDLVFELMNFFPGSKIVPCGEVILSDRGNISFTVKGIESRNEIIYKLLEWCSRPIAKGEFYSNHYRNRDFRRSLLCGYNNYLGTHFTEGDMWLIYDQLGNAVDHKKTIRFVDSNFDMNVLKEGGK